jgi:tetratricopeptide (TPR) repeat protein
MSAPDVKRLRETGRHAEALALARQGLAAAPGDAALCLEAAFTHDSLGLEADAVGLYRAALAAGLAPAQRREALVCLGSSLRALGRYEEARQTLEQAVHEHPAAAEAKAFLAMTLHNGGQSQAAVQMLLQLLAESSADPGIRRYRRALEFYARDVGRAWPQPGPESSDPGRSASR